MSCHHPFLDEARERLDRALGGINTLHLGPLDYNIFTTVDELMAAARLIEAYGKEKASLAVVHEERDRG